MWDSVGFESGPLRACTDPPVTAMTTSEDTAETIRSLRFSLNIPADKYKAYYQGHVQFIQVRSHDGRTVRLPASSVREFLTTSGISGEFEVRFDQNNKLVGISKI